MIGRIDLINLVQRSRVDGIGQKEYEDAKGIIAIAINEQYNHYAKVGFLGNLCIPKDFDEKVKKSNLPADIKQILMGGRK